ncbi:hypothetical protein A2572_04160 [Candidatus Collierbacteria bacterium RIFOXYD1_FULL_40_9]|uniref:Uncharacterized protein n=1 Tax=Candidatus Collierbacteria bacterium RIFOXYD1_FULL_40_9 TaxID=1817731 RepID=A0A1F5FPS5_9BACT|nr:MAG: hypothetical protein A2572_04160 [Candidatus Collierbacteria bacterium RIFOXYD1_FULL_40_9]
MPPRFEYDISLGQEPNIEKPIKSSTVLANELGLKRDESEKPTSRDRSYLMEVLAPFPISVGGETRTFSGLAYLRFEDFGGEKKNLKRIYTGVLIADDKGEAYRVRGVSVTKIDEIAKQIDFSVDHESFNKTALENGGYNKLESILSKLIKDGYYHQKAEAARLTMEKEIAGYHKRVNQILIPELGKVFPGYAPMQIDYFKMGNAYFSPDKPSIKSPVLEIDMMSNRIYVAYKKGRIFYCVHPPFNRMPGDEPIASWPYEIGQSVQEVTREALKALKADIESTYLSKIKK